MQDKYKSLQGTKLSDIRAKINNERYKRNMPKTFAWLTFDIFLYVLGISTILQCNHWALQLLGGLIAGWATSVLFVWGHDAAHGALFKNKIIAEILGSLAMLPSLNMYRLWCYGHNRVHHGFTSMTEVDWIWKPLSPKEYQQKSKMQQFIYRLERSFFSCALHYFLRVWWQKMIRFKLPELNAQFLVVKAVTFLLAALAFIAVKNFTASYFAAICAVIIPFIVFNYVIAFFVYLHHTHPEIPYFKTRDQWSFAVGGISCCTVIRMSKLSEIMTHNIMIHVPHHVDFRVPFYHLKGAYGDLKSDYEKYITEYKFSWNKVFKIFGKCKLFDYEQQIWYNFDDIK